MNQKLAELLNEKREVAHVGKEEFLVKIQCDQCGYFLFVVDDNI